MLGRLWRFFAYSPLQCRRVNRKRFPTHQGSLLPGAVNHRFSSVGQSPRLLNAAAARWPRWLQCVLVHTAKIMTLTKVAQQLRYRVYNFFLPTCVTWKKHSANYAQWPLSIRISQAQVHHISVVNLPVNYSIQIPNPLCWQKRSSISTRDMYRLVRCSAI